MKRGLLQTNTSGELSTARLRALKQVSPNVLFPHSINTLQPSEQATTGHRDATKEQTLGHLILRYLKALKHSKPADVFGLSVIEIQHCVLFQTVYPHCTKRWHVSKTNYY